MKKTKAYSAASATSPLAPDTIRRRDTTERDVEIDILYCGVCHSDLHTVRDEWGSSCPRPTRACRGTRSSAGSPAVGSAVTKLTRRRPRRGRLPGRLRPQLPQLRG